MNVEIYLSSNILRHTTNICFHNLSFWKETKKGKVDNKSARNSGINLFPIHEFFMSHDKHKSLSETELSFRPMFKSCLPAGRNELLQNHILRHAL